MAHIFMNEHFKKLFMDKFVLLSCFGTLAFILFHGLFLLLFFQKLPPIVPLFNQMPWGEARFAPKIQVSIPLGVATVFLFMNLFVSAFLSLSHPLATRLLAATSFLIALFAFIIIIRTVLIVI